MNLASTLLALALLGMDDTTSRSAKTAQGSAEVKSKADGRTAPQTAPADRIGRGVMELKQGEQAGQLRETLRMPLPKFAKPRMSQNPEAPEPWLMTLQTAIMIGLDNSEIVRVISFGAQGCPISGFEPTSPTAGSAVPTSDDRPAPIVIARLTADADPSRFKAEVMALVCSVEQQYWALAQAQVHARAIDTAVNLEKEVFKKEQADLHMCRGSVADVAEAAQRLEQLQLDLATRNSDVVSSERQLRNILGLPPADNRQIMPVTPACEAKFEPIWDTCVAEMLEHSPDIEKRKTALRNLRDQIAVASTTVSDDLVKAHAGRPGRKTTKNDPESRKRMAEREAELDQTIHRQVLSLARSFQNIDANYKELQTAKRLKAATVSRLEAQRAHYEAGRITIDRFLDAVSQNAMAVGIEARYKAMYNTSMVGLKEAKGTLLADDGIVVAERPKRRKSLAAQQDKTDAAAKPAAFVAVPESGPVPPSASAAIGFAPIPALEMGCCESKKAASTAATRSWTFSFTIGSGPNAVQIKGTIAADDHVTPTP